MGPDHQSADESRMHVRQILGGEGMERLMIPYKFEGFWVLSLDHKLVTAFGEKLSFRAYIDRSRRLHIVSEERLL